MSNFIYYEKLEDYEEQVKKAELCDKKDKEIKRLNNIFDELKERIKNNMQYDDNIDNSWTTTNELFEILDKIGVDKE